MHILLTFLSSLILITTAAQDKIGVIDVFGDKTVPANSLRQALGFKEGDLVASQKLDHNAILQRLKDLPGVKRATLELVCCDENSKGYIAYVGLSANYDSLTYYLSAPKGRQLLPPVIVTTYREYQTAMEAAVKRGQTKEDSDSGYALLEDPAARRKQLKFIELASQYQNEIDSVLHLSGYAEHRAIAAMMIGYNKNRKYAVQELLYAVYDPDIAVRNNALRALGLLANYVWAYPMLKIRIPPTPFIPLLNSLSWTDRNKASLVLFSLTHPHRDRTVLPLLKKECLPALEQMARWRNVGHAFYAYAMINRIAGMDDSKFFEALKSERKHSYLDSMLTIINRQ